MFYFMTVFCFVFCQGLYIGTLKCRGSIIVYTIIHTYINTYIWVLASTLAHSASEINKALSVTYKLLFTLSKNIIPSQRYRAFPVTRLPPPIYTKFNVSNGIYIDLGAGKHPGPLCFKDK